MVIIFPDFLTNVFFLDVYINVCISFFLTLRYSLVIK